MDYSSDLVVGLGLDKSKKAALKHHFANFTKNLNTFNVRPLRRSVCHSTLISTHNGSAGSWVLVPDLSNAAVPDESLLHDTSNANISYVQGCVQAFMTAFSKHPNMLLFSATEALMEA